MMNNSTEHLYFIAILPPAAAIEQLMAYKHYFAQHYGARAALRSPPHITLHMPFKFKESKEPLLHKLLASFAGQCQPCRLTLNGFGAFAPKVIYVKVEDNPCLTAMQARLLRHMRRDLYLFNGNYKDMAFKPHVTVAFRDLKKAAFHEAWPQYAQKQVYLQFSTAHLTLLRHNGQQWQVHRQYPIGQEVA